MIANAQTVSFVMFDNIKAYEKNGGVQIEWTNLTERDLHGYIIERSGDGHSFDTIDHQLPTSNDNDRADYKIYDEAPKRGVNFYRIRVAGITGRSAVSTLLKVEVEENNKNFNLYPNPISGDQVSINISAEKKGSLMVKVYNVAGYPVFLKTIYYQGRSMTETLQLPALLKAGLYTMLVTDGDWSQKRIFIKK